VAAVKIGQWGLKYFNRRRRSRISGCENLWSVAI